MSKCTEFSLSDEIAKAVQAVAKVVPSVQRDIAAVGRFLERVLGRPTEQLGGLLGDVAALMRFELAVRFVARTEKLMKDRGLEQPTRNAALALVHPLFSAASLEEDETISDMFANLLVNALDASSGVDVHKSFVETVRVMSPLEAKILHAMAHAPASSLSEGGFMFTAGLPEKYYLAPSPSTDLEDEVPESVSLAIAALSASGCIACAMSWGGATIDRQAKVTVYGRALIKATNPID